MKLKKKHLEIKMSCCMFRETVKKEMQYWGQGNRFNNDAFCCTILNFTNCTDKMVQTKFRRRLSEDMITDPCATTSTVITAAHFIVQCRCFQLQYLQIYLTTSITQSTYFFSISEILCPDIPNSSVVPGIATATNHKW